MEYASPAHETLAMFRRYDLREGAARVIRQALKRAGPDEIELVFNYNTVVIDPVRGVVTVFGLTTDEEPAILSTREMVDLLDAPDLRHPRHPHHP